ncbi:hypothetical protein [Blastococcus sp. SYSU D01042]
MSRTGPFLVPERVSAALLAAVGALNLAPAVLAVQPGRIPQAYGVTPDSAAAELLLRHRAVLLGLVGGWLTAAARFPALRTPAIAAAAVSKVSFLALAATGEPTAELRRVARADAVAVAPLLLVLLGERGRKPSRRVDEGRSRSTS